MTAEEFWQIIEKSRLMSKGDQDRQVEALREILLDLSADDIFAFHLLFTRTVIQAYSWDLWGAAYIINGGCSDDGFEYFRYWLIAKGQKAFENALREPDSLADVVSKEDADCVDFEEFGYFASDTWCEKTGKLLEEFPESSKIQFPKEPSGTRWEEDDSDAFAERYPKLSAIFNS